MIARHASRIDSKPPMIIRAPSNGMSAEFIRGSSRMRATAASRTAFDGYSIRALARRFLTWFVLPPKVA